MKIEIYNDDAYRCIAQTRLSRKLKKECVGIITDPPYGIGYWYGGGGGKSSTLENIKSAIAKQFHGKSAMIQGDARPFDPAPILEIGDVHVFWGANHYHDRLPQGSKWLVWDKIVHQENYGKLSFSDCEMAWTDIKGGISCRIFRQLWQGCLRAGDDIPHEIGKLHPNRKPVQLMEWCIAQAARDLKNKHLVIFDPFMGVGTTGVAAINLGLDFIGIEIDKKYFNIAKERLRRAEEVSNEKNRQMELFASKSRDDL